MFKRALESLAVAGILASAPACNPVQTRLDEQTRLADTYAAAGMSPPHRLTDRNNCPTYREMPAPPDSEKLEYYERLFEGMSGNLSNFLGAPVNINVLSIPSGTFPYPDKPSVGYHHVVNNMVYGRDTYDFPYPLDMEETRDERLKKYLQRDDGYTTPRDYEPFDHTMFYGPLKIARKASLTTRLSYSHDQNDEDNPFPTYPSGRIEVPVNSWNLESVDITVYPCDYFVFEMKLKEDGGTVKVVMDNKKQTTTEYLPADPDDEDGRAKLDRFNKTLKLGVLNDGKLEIQLTESGEIEVGPTNREEFNELISQLYDYYVQREKPHIFPQLLKLDPTEQKKEFLRHFPGMKKTLELAEKFDVVYGPDKTMTALGYFLYSFSTSKYQYHGVLDIPHMRDDYTPSQTPKIINREVRPKKIALPGKVKRITAEPKGNLEGPLWVDAPGLRNALGDKSAHSETGRPWRVKDNLEPIYFTIETGTGDELTVVSSVEKDGKISVVIYDVDKKQVAETIIHDPKAEPAQELPK